MRPPPPKRRRRQNLTPSERAQLNRDRNREHARNTRLRKKAFVEELQRVLHEYQEQEAKDKEHKSGRRRLDTLAQDVALRRSRELLELLLLPAPRPQASRREKKPPGDTALLGSLLAAEGALEVPVGIMLLQNGAPSAAAKPPGRPDEAGTVRLASATEVVTALRFTRQYVDAAAMASGVAAGPGSEEHRVLRLVHLQVAHAGPVLSDAPLSPVPNPRPVVKIKSDDDPMDEEAPEIEREALAPAAAGPKTADLEEPSEKCIRLFAKWEVYCCPGPGPPAAPRARAARSPRAKSGRVKADDSDAAPKRDEADSCDSSEDELRFEAEPAPAGTKVISGFIRMRLVAPAAPATAFALPPPDQWHVSHASLHCDASVAVTDGPTPRSRRPVGAGDLQVGTTGGRGALEGRLSSEDETLTTASASAPSSSSDADDTFLEALRLGAEPEVVDVVRKLRNRSLAMVDAGASPEGLPPLSTIVTRVREARDTLLRLAPSDVLPTVPQSGAGVMVSVIPLEQDRFLGRVRLVAPKEADAGEAAAARES